jgi:hypothetical protein
MRTNKVVKDVLYGTHIVKFTKSLWVRGYVHVERMQSKLMPKQIAIAAIEGTRGRGGPYKRGRDDVEEDLNIMGINIGRQCPETGGNGGRSKYNGNKNVQAMSRDWREWRKV